MRILENINPKRVMSFFEDICAIPHGSGNTKQISDLCVSFAKERGLRYYQDDLNNVVIYKDASEGYEDSEPVILQGHLDMVCASDESCTIDMERTVSFLKLTGSGYGRRAPLSELTTLLPLL